MQFFPKQKFYFTPMFVFGEACENEAVKHRIYITEETHLTLLT